MERETSCINSRAILDYLKEQNADCSILFGDLDPEIDGLEDPDKFLRNPNNWISCSIISKLYKRAKLILHDEMAAYKIGRYASENITLGYAQRIVFKSFWSVRKTLKNAQKINDQWNRNKKVELIELKQNEAIIRLHWNPEMEVTKDICLYNQGAYTSLPLVWGGSPLTLKEKCCYFNGAPYCEYHIKWPFKNKFYEIISRFFTSKSVLMDTIKEMERDKKIIEEKTKKLKNEIEDRKQAEEALGKSEKKYRSFIDNAPLGMYTLNTKGEFTYVNKRLLEITRYKTEDWLNKPFCTIVHPDDLDIFIERVGDRFAGKGTADPYEVRFFNSTGEIMYVKLTDRTINETDEKGEKNVVGIQTFVEDITDKKLTEEALKESQSKFHSLFALSPQAIALSEFETGKLVDVNEKFCELSKYAREEIIGLTTTKAEFFSEEGRHRFIKELQTSGEINGLEMNFKVKDGSILNTLVFSRLIRIAGATFILTICVDVTNQKQLEAQLQQARKMEALGLMAGGIAHDLNNILSGIVSYPDLILMDLSEDSPLRKPIETIKASGHRAADVVSDLLTVARGVATNKEVLNLNTIIKEHFSSAEHNKIEKMNPSITFKTHLDYDLLNISCSSIHIKKCLLNLVANASESIEGIGNVIITTMNHYLSEPLTGYENVRQGQYAVLTVSDDGSGILPDDLERIFEPFYTKKVMGRSGTGLGLAVVWNTVQDHEGYINVKSGEEGTIFELYFPITRDELTAENGYVPFEDYVGHGERILVVDDEENQREIACGILTKLGYRAKSFSNGEEAVEYLKEHTVDLILLDMIMDPGINGRETYERIINLHPDQKAIIASGFSESDDVKAVQKLGTGQYIKKPYTLEKIGIAVRDELKK